MSPVILRTEERECPADQEKLRLSLPSFWPRPSFQAAAATYPMSFEAKGIPVKTLKPSAEDVAAAEKAHQEQEKEIAAMASVTGNSSFTEKRGMPEYLLGPGDVLKITYWEGDKSTEYIVEVRSDGKISYAFMDDVQVSGRTVGELYEALIEGLTTIHPGAATRGRRQGVREQAGSSVWPDQQDLPRAVRSREVCPERENVHPGPDRVGRRSRHGTGRFLHGSGPDAGRRGGRRRKRGSAQRGASAQGQALHAQPL